ncbi:MAG: acylphosphatase [Bacteroidota bacterium]
MVSSQIKFTVFGLVQGVGFRYFVARNAISMGLRGYVRNEFDGTVSGVAIGDPASIDKLKSLLQAGPSRSKVEKVLFEDYSGEDIFVTFEIR